MAEEDILRSDKPVGDARRMEPIAATESWTTLRWAAPKQPQQRSWPSAGKGGGKGGKGGGKPAAAKGGGKGAGKGKGSGKGKGGGKGKGAKGIAKKSLNGRQGW